MDERTAKLRERNRRKRDKKKGVNIKLIVDIMYFVTVVLIIVGFCVSLPLLFLIGGIVMLLGTAYYVFNCILRLKNNPAKSPEHKDALVALIFFAIMALIAIMAIVFAAVEMV